MPHYFYVLDHLRFHERIHPALSASWKARSFAACQPLCADLLPAAAEFRRKFHLGAADLILPQIAQGLAFDRHLWRLLVGEVLLVAATEIPELETAPETLCCLLAPALFGQHVTDRRRFAPIQHVHFGARDLVFDAAIYRPENVGWNDENDVNRLADYLSSLEPAQWRPKDLRPIAELDEAGREEELADARAWFPGLVNLYQRARTDREIIVTEVI